MNPNDRKRGLGRGLSALMSDVTVDAAGPDPRNAGGGRQTLPVEWIEANPDQPRKRFDADHLAELTASIKEKGIIQPLIVRKLGHERFQIVAGERRWRAAQQANLHDVPVVVRDFSDLEVVEIAIIENVQRADLNPVEEATGYRQLMDRFGHTQEKLAEALGKSRSHIANILRLLQLPQQVLDMLAAGDLSSGHARALIPAEDAAALADQVVKQGLSVRATEALVKKTLRRDAPEPKAKVRAIPQSEKDADTRALESDLSAALGMQVSVDHAAGGDGGKVIITYHGFEQLDDLCRRLGGD